MSAADQGSSRPSIGDQFAASSHGNDNIFWHEKPEQWSKSETVAMNHDRFATQRELHESGKLPRAGHRKRFAKVASGSDALAPGGFKLFAKRGNSSALEAQKEDGVVAASYTMGRKENGRKSADDSMSMPKSQGGIEVKGTYRRLRSKDALDPIQPMESVNVLAVEDMAAKPKRKKDPFSRFKPRTPSDVNLLALSQVRFAPFAVSKPQPLAPDYFASSTNYMNRNPGSMYEQIFRANDNRLRVMSQSSNYYDGDDLRISKPLRFAADEDDTSPTLGPPPKLISRTKQAQLLALNSMMNPYLRYPSPNLRFNAMNFQPMPYGMLPDTRNAAIYQNTKLNPKLSNDNSPNELILHLNLIPKKKRKRNDRQGKSNSAAYVGKTIDDGNQSSKLRTGFDETNAFEAVAEEPQLSTGEFTTSLTART